MNKYITGLYFTLSQEDERAGESLSIDNQRQILRKYAEDHGFTEYLPGIHRRRGVGNDV